MLKSKLRAYASLITRKGVNVQKNQGVIINTELEQPEFIEILVEECYKAGAGRVDVRWHHEPLTRAHVKYQKENELSRVFDWEIQRYKAQSEDLPCVIWIISEDPDALNGIDQEKYAKAMQARSKIFKPIRDKMDDRYQWCIAAVPGVKWAKKIFPDCRKSVAVEKLWELILKTARADINPIEQWNSHNSNLEKRCKYLNSLNIRYLHYKSSNGTDLKVGMIPDSHFCAGAGKTIGGVVYNANIPSEECFISPMKGVCEGTVYSTKPLAYQGELIENFYFVFKDGKVSEYYAKKNEALLAKLLDMDENARYLGECALVPFESPINQSGVLFYNTLFDENACCHLALGRGFNETIDNFEKLSFEECINKGVNDSIIHVDFMIGTDDLEITGIDAEGKKITIFKNGTWENKEG